ncbi:hypothetical protein D3C87_1383830 [compost metagenome]
MGADRRTDPDPRPAASMEKRLRTRLPHPPVFTAEKTAGDLLQRPARQPRAGRRPAGARSAHRRGACAGSIAARARSPADLQDSFGGPGQRSQRLALRTGAGAGTTAICPGTLWRQPVGQQFLLAAAQPGGPGARRQTRPGTEKLAGVCRAKVWRNRRAARCAERPASAKSANSLGAKPRHCRQPCRVAAYSQG